MYSLTYFFLSFVQAATEFLPVSSSGHLLFLKGTLHIEEISIIFDILLHVGSLTAILVFYHKKIIHLFRGAWFELIDRRMEKNQLRFLVYAILSTIVTFVFYLFLKGPIEAKYQSPNILFFAFLFTTILLFSTRFSDKKEKALIHKKGWFLPIIVGVFQGLAIMPGVSRSGSTISSLLHMGVKKEDAAFYSFFLAIPAILGAFFFKLLKLDNLVFLKENGAIGILSLLISIVFSFLFLKLLTLVLKKGKFWYFSIYTVIVSIVSLFLFNIG